MTAWEPMSAKAIPRCVILGGGGHARVVVDALLLSEAAIPYAVLDADQSLWGTMLLSVPIRGGDASLDALTREGVTTFVVGLGGVRENGPRQRLFELGLQHGLTPLTVRHPSAVCSPWAEIGPGSVLLPTSVVNAGAKLGVNVIVNSGAIIEHDCLIGDHVHIATGATLASTVTVGRLAHIGAGATIRQCLRIGEAAVVGAGAVVVDEVPAGAVVAGVPARPLRNAQAATPGMWRAR